MVILEGLFSGVPVDAKIQGCSGPLYDVEQCVQLALHIYRIPIGD